MASTHPTIKGSPRAGSFKDVRALSRSSKEVEEMLSDSQGSAEFEVTLMAEKMMRSVGCRRLTPTVT